MRQFAIYKGVKGKYGAIQFDIKPYNSIENQAGVVFVNACSTTGPNQYNWDNKFTFALSVGDISKILHFFMTSGEEGKLSLVHDPNMKSQNAGKTLKTMNFFTKQGVLDGMMVTATTKAKGNTISHQIPFSGDEVVALKVLLERAISILIGWTDDV